MKRQINPVLSVSGLTIERGSKTILNRIDWTINPGESWVILGPNGSGKTSLLNALTGYLTPSEGDVFVLGERFGQADWRDLRKSVGLVSSGILQQIANEETPENVVISGKYAVINYWGKIKGEDQHEAQRILHEVDADHLAGRSWMYLSQGERQRVLIGRALMAKPKLLILDEPCSGLDPVARDHFLTFVERLGQSLRGPTIILVTHHVEEIRPMFSHVLLLSEGTMSTQGPIDTTLTSKALSSAFSSPIKLSKSKNGFRITL